MGPDPEFEDRGKGEGGCRRVVGPTVARKETRAPRRGGGEIGKGEGECRRESRGK